MKFTDITDTENIAQSIETLKGGKSYDKFDDAKNEYEVSEKRDIMNPSVYLDKTKKDKEGNTKGVTRVNRIPLALEKRIVDSTVSFTFGNPVEVTCEQDDAMSLNILAAIKRMLSDNKIDSFNRQIARDIARCTESAEVWFPVDTKESHSHYGFSTPFKIRVQQFSPWKGDLLYPFYDKTGDMVAFSREFRIKENGKEVIYFETYTDEQKIVWRKADSDWEAVGTPEPNQIKKIPVVYGQQDYVEWNDVEPLIKRLQKLISKFGDTNDYFASPSYAVSGDILGMPDKEETGKVFQLSSGGDIKVVSWDQLPEAIKLEIDTLIRFIFGNSQTPDLSFDAVKGLDLSGKAMKYLFMDAHLKVKTKREIFDPYLQRRINILKAYVGQLNTAWKKQASAIEIIPNIVPYIINDESDLVDMLTTATAGKPIISQKTAVAKSGLVDNVDEEYKQIQAEAEQANTLSVFPPAA